MRRFAAQPVRRLLGGRALNGETAEAVAWDWLGAENATIRLAGHSHRLAFRESMALLPDELQRRVAVLDLNGRTLPAPGAFRPAPNDDYWRLAAAAGTSTALVWDGNQHNARFLLSDTPFSVVGREPVEPLAELVVPYRMMRALFERDLEASGLMKFLEEHPQPASVLIVGTPPPKSEQQVRQGLLNDGPLGQGFFVDALAKVGLTLESAPLTPAATRVAAWEALQEATEAAATGAGAAFVPVPEWMRTEDGTLREEYCEPDTTHANTAYGAAMWQEIAARAEGA
jgi:hypothetical protein